MASDTTLQSGQPLGGRFTGASGPRVIGPRGGKAVDLRSLGARFLVWAGESGGNFSIVEHPIPPRTLIAPLHRHEREDEYSFILEGRMGAQLGDEVVVGAAGDFIFKPRHQWHTFWNAGDAPCRVLEIIAPGGFERFFDELADLMAATNAPNPGVALAGSDLPARYAISFRPESLDELCRRHSLLYPTA